MYCSYCSTRLHDGARFCHYCGSVTPVCYPAQQAFQMQLSNQIQNICEQHRQDRMAWWALWLAILGATPVSIVGPIVSLVLSSKVLSQNPENKMAKTARIVAICMLVLFVILLIIVLIVVAVNTSGSSYRRNVNHF